MGDQAAVAREGAGRATVARRVQGEEQGAPRVQADGLLTSLTGRILAFRPECQATGEEFWVLCFRLIPAASLECACLVPNLSLPVLEL